MEARVDRLVVVDLELHYAGDAGWESCIARQPHVMDIVRVQKQSLQSTPELWYG